MFLRSIAILLVIVLPTLALAAPPISYVILKEGEPIGHETVTITEGSGQTVVEVRTDTRVKVLFLDFHYNHRRVETWHLGQLEGMVADTDDDGSIHHIDLVRKDDGYRLTVDGVLKDMPEDALPLSLWSKSILNRKLLFGVSDGAPYHVSIQALGPASILRNGQEVTTDHYRIAGEIERDLWYASDGVLLKTAFQRRGYPIEIVRE
jgi:hypothetical protein